MNSKQIDVLTIIFDNEIAPYEVPAFRGAIVAALSNKNILFHNHDGDNLRFAYPLIQYKRIRSNAAIVCVGEGTEAISELFQSHSPKITIGDREVEMRVKNIKADRVLVQVWQSHFSYQLRRYIPFNKENYEAYLHTDNLVERCLLMEKCLVGNILSMGKGLDIRFEDPIEVKITNCAEPKLVSHKGVKMMAFDLSFTSNVSLPNYIGLGKAPAFGFGTISIQEKSKIFN